MTAAGDGREWGGLYSASGGGFGLPRDSDGTDVGCSCVWLYVCIDGKEGKENDLGSG